MTYEQSPLGRLIPSTDQSLSTVDTSTLREALMRLATPVCMTNEGVTTQGTVCFDPQSTQGTPLTGLALPLPLERCGDAVFCAAHGLRYPMVGGSMAKGISSAAMVIELGQHGMLGFFGSAGLPLETVDATITQLQQALPEGPFGVNLIHSPNEPDLENALVDLYLKRNVHLIEASAFLSLSPAVVRYRLHGIHRDGQGNIVTPNRIIAKVSREEVARHFLSPPPQKILDELVAQHVITAEQAALARQIPMAEDVTAEADSGGHTDNRPALSLFPTICALRDTLHQEFGYATKPRVGLGGGIATPTSAAAAIAMGAAYLVTGTVNQACCESGTSDIVRQMLAEARQADIAMAPAADMFEMGVDVQVLKRGTMFSMRAAKLYELYKRYASLDQLPVDERDKLEKTFFRASLNDVWNSTREFFLKRDPRQVQRAEQDPKHLMALVFRSYLGQATHWANDGDTSRRMDFQIWCGPSMGAFNEWVRGSFLEQPHQRRVVCVNLNILFGAAVLTRANTLRRQGVVLNEADVLTTPLTTEQIKECLRD
ncbi:PfaD family polyunsaturated fatty acid/polyketide biosynthesis protein [Desulfuromonas acetoxidans]|nr:PfaD family polyunsaturated fatty acid/polyketide biosynthesis protein [Desulfuromonas acetoxidans]MBF0644913.1 PfaD family polyunsaturated fatty acid/polyketide biosynthesis protein [Desulfuromonas acetoxidans]NVD25430.1 PfaD family polyunsaturated fatty acid/polyketide biosynthesis protein [Desulfuromonas acetoxidans]NVE17469.1 PfaD family polyunsaturated fatty acid/polyketide biosynthesis protein [Desulfuromonas acetoxidans]